MKKIVELSNDEAREYFFKGSSYFNSDLPNYIGLEHGLKEWRRFLKPGGYIAVSEGSWFTAERPQEIRDFWMDAYPEIDTIPVKVAQLQSSGDVPVAAFILPDECWTTHFFAPQEAAQERFLEKHPGNKAAEELVANMRHEAVLFDKYHAYYGYVFYIGRKLE